MLELFDSHFPPPAAPDVQAMRQLLDAIAAQDWTAYVDLEAVGPAERSAMLAAGEPLSITLNSEERTPVAIWKGDTVSSGSAFGEITVPSSEHAGSAGYPISDPFKALDLDALPPSTVTCRLTDPRHTATAALHELVSLLLRDLERIAKAESGSIAWRTFLQHARLLRQSADTALSYLGHDHYAGWDPRLPEISVLQQAASAINQHAATTAAQQRIALHYTAYFFTKMLRTAEMAPNVDDADRAALVLSLLRESFVLIQTELDTFNSSCAHGLGIVPSAVSMRVVFRPKGILHPVFVAVPIAQLAPTTVLNPPSS